ncbi:MAG: glutamine synthetase [Gammaproteobacteria bacterium]|nr:glutamine synthetase [Gammaproteobacteria bacterium]
MSDPHVEEQFPPRQSQLREPLVFVGTSDLSGHFRGKSFAASELAGRMQRGVGLAPTNIYMGAFGPIQFTSFGTVGEVFLVPDPTTRVFVPFEGGASEFFFIGDIRTGDGTPWDFCPRHLLRRALGELRRETGLELYASFEQELIYRGVPSHPWHPYELDALRRQGLFGETLLGAMRQAGVTPDSFLAEYGPQQFEVTSAPAKGLRAADDAVIVRELTRAVAGRFGQEVSLTPLPAANGVGNGTHVHFSFLDADGGPVLYDEHRPWNLADTGRQFVAGIQLHLPALCALTTPSVVSYFRLRPNRWAPVYADARPLDRGAAVRIAPLNAPDTIGRARQLNVEFRVADATASPYLTLAAIVHAGVDGIRRHAEINPDDRRPLPASLAEALTLLERTPAARSWLGAELLAGYLAFKRAELAALDGLEEGEICRRYAEVY